MTHVDSQPDATGFWRNPLYEHLNESLSHSWSGEYVSRVPIVLRNMQTVSYSPDRSSAISSPNSKNFKEIKTLNNPLAIGISSSPPVNFDSPVSPALSCYTTPVDGLQPFSPPHTPINRYNFVGATLDPLGNLHLCSPFLGHPQSGSSPTTPSRSPHTDDLSSDEPLLTQTGETESMQDMNHGAVPRLPHIRSMLHIKGHTEGLPTPTRHTTGLMTMRASPKSHQRDKYVWERAHASGLWQGKAQAAFQQLAHDWDLLEEETLASAATARNRSIARIAQRRGSLYAASSTSTNPHTPSAMGSTSSSIHFDRERYRTRVGAVAHSESVPGKNWQRVSCTGMPPTFQATNGDLVPGVTPKTGAGAANTSGHDQPRKMSTEGRVSQIDPRRTPFSMQDRQKLVTPTRSHRVQSFVATLRSGAGTFRPKPWNVGAVKSLQTPPVATLRRSNSSQPVCNRGSDSGARTPCTAPCRTVAKQGRYRPTTAPSSQSGSITRPSTNVPSRVPSIRGSQPFSIRTASQDTQLPLRPHACDMMRIPADYSNSQRHRGPVPDCRSPLIEPQPCHSPQAVLRGEQPPCTYTSNPVFSTSGVSKGPEDVLSTRSVRPWKQGDALEQRIFRTLDYQQRPSEYVARKTSQIKKSFQQRLAQSEDLAGYAKRVANVKGAMRLRDLQYGDDDEVVRVDDSSVFSRLYKSVTKRKSISQKSAALAQSTPSSAWR